MPCLRRRAPDYALFCYLCFCPRETMPHQLRRIITINIRNPKDGMPSGRIAELDPRGGVLAVGINGVGKTTFLRLLPLFYGATPTQILKGTGRTALISHTLPDQSSAVCYEYERHTPNDVRCVVMHARPGEEAPQFHIVSGPYRESYFYDENNQYVTRDEFKARVEAMGVEVSRKLTLHQYRSVILNERLPTKEGVELRRMAAVHSLGPGALYNLDQIAAAMANEKLSFRDLKNIVVERVSDASTAANKTTNVKELKQNRESVVRWMEARTHLVEIMKQKPAAAKLSEGVTRIKRIHMELCSLHVAVKKAIDQLGKEVGDLKGREERLTTEFNTRGQEMQDTIGVCKSDLQASTAQRDDLQKQVKAWDAQMLHFQTVQIETVEKLHSREADLQAQLAQNGRELQDLEGAAGSATTRADQRRAQVDSNAALQSERAQERERAAFRQFEDRMQALRKAEEDAIEQLVHPERTQEIARQRLTLASQLGALKAQIDKPTASQRALDDLEIANAVKDQANVDLMAAIDLAREAKDALDKADSQIHSTVDQVDRLTQRCATIAQGVDRIQSTLTPAPGSLLEFIRKGDPVLWSSAAKLLDPQLLARDDLAPLYLEDVAPAIEGRVAIGSALLHVGDVPAPAWMDMAEVRQELLQLQTDAQAAASELAIAQQAAKDAAKQLREAQKHESTVRAHESLARTALQNATTNRNRAAQFVQAEALRQKDAAVKQQAELNALRNGLDTEERQIEANFADSKRRVRADFVAQREALDLEKQDVQGRLEAERTGISARKEEALLAIKEDLQRELQGLGVDPQRIEALRQSRQDIESLLASIAANRHEVTAWRQFQREVLPSLEVNRQELSRRDQRCHELVARKSQLEQEKDAFELEAKRELKTVGDAISGRESEIQRLTALLTREVRDFLDHVPAHLHVDWMTSDLEQAVAARKESLDGESSNLQRELRVVRNELIRFPGGPADWLDGKEKELPDPQILLSHQYLCEQAQVLCDWFDPTESGPYIDQLNKEMFAYFNLAGEFVRVLDQFERRVTSFNRELQQALTATEHFARFSDLSVKVSSNVGQLGHMKLLREMQDRGTRNPLSFRSATLSEKDLPTDEDAALVRAFREVLEADGAFRVNLHDQVRLECSLYENGKLQVVSNEEEFRSVSSNGNSALITAVFLMGFTQMIRGDSPVRLTWVVDEIGRFDGGNLSAFLHTLDKHKIDVISACPSLDPALGRYFKRICLFEDNGAVFSSENQEIEEAQDVAA